jgi:hypothetical protein
MEWHFHSSPYFFHGEILKYVGNFTFTFTLKH